MPCKQYQKKAKIVVLISEGKKKKEELKTNISTGANKEGYFTIIIGSIPREDKTIINIYALTARSLKYMKQN